jgi:hypothetical protein
MSAGVAPQRLASLDSHYVDRRGLYKPASSKFIHLAASMLLTAAALYWLDRGLRADRIAVEVDRPKGELVFIAPLPPKAIERPQVTPRPNRNPVVKAHVSTYEQAEPDAPNNAISITSDADRRIDWSEQSAISAGAVADARANPDVTLDSKPKILELPSAASHSKAGVTQHLGGGEIITWINERCYVTNMPSANPSLDKNKINKICKRDGEDDGVMFDHLRPSHLGGPKTEAGKRKAGE